MAELLREWEQAVAEWRACEAMPARFRGGEVERLAAQRVMQLAERIREAMRR